MMLVVGVTSCSVEEKADINVQEVNLLTTGNDGNIITAECGDAIQWPFGSLDVGKVVVTKDLTTIFVKIIPSEGHNLVQSRIQLAKEVSEFPTVGGGNLPPGQMEERNHDDGNYEFPLSLFEGECQINISAWAVFTAGGSEAGKFAGNLYFVPENENLGLYFEFCIDDCIEPPVMICETAFMEGNRPFLGKNLPYSLNLGNSRWGWANYYSGGDGLIREELYACAGQNNTTNATLVGYVTTTITGSNVTVKIKMEPGFEDALNLTHIYFSGAAPTTNAPGLYGNTEENPYDGIEYPFTLNNAGDPFYLIVHAEVCQEE